MKTNFKFEVDLGNGSKDIAFTRVVHSIHFHKFDGGHLVFSRWPKVNNVRPLDNMKTKFEEDWGNGSKDIVFTKAVHSIHFDRGHLVFRRWPNVYSVHPLDNIKTNLKFEVDWGNGPKDIAFTRVVHISNIFKSSILFLTDGHISKCLFSR